MTIRTVQLASGVLAQGELVHLSVKDGVSYGTIATDLGNAVTGKLMPQHTDMTRPGDTIHDT